MDIVKLFQAIKNFATNTTFEITGKVETDLSPVVKAIKEIPEQEIADSINISNLKEVNDEIAKLSKGVVDVIKSLDTDVDLSEVVNAIKSIPKVELPEQIDYSQNIVKELQSLSKALAEKKEGNQSKELINKLFDIEETIENEFEAVSLKGRLKVSLPDEQIEKMGKSISVAAGSGIIKNEAGPITESNPLPVLAELEVSDIQIGAVEIKDGTNGNRQTVHSDGTAFVRTQEVEYESYIDDYTTTDMTYFGTAVVGSVDSAASWKIYAINETGNYLAIKFADSVTTYSKVWDNRTTYTY